MTQESAAWRVGALMVRTAADFYLMLIATGASAALVGHLISLWKKAQEPSKAVYLTGAYIVIGLFLTAVYLIAMGSD